VVESGLRAVVILNNTGDLGALDGKLMPMSRSLLLLLLLLLLRVILPIASRFI
jgi:hypothetical protein